MNDNTLTADSLRAMLEATIPDRFDWLQRYGDLLMVPPPFPVPLQPTSFPRFDMAEAEARTFCAFPSFFSDRMKEVQAFHRLAYNKEPNDCGVRALAVACAAPYAKSHAAFKVVGRADGGSTSLSMIVQAMLLLNCEAVDSTPLMGVTTVQKCKRELANSEGGYVIVTCDHALGVWNGEIIAWDSNSKQHICKVFKARRIET